MSLAEAAVSSREVVAAKRKRFVLYLRVSTPFQVNTDYDPEGISIPAQREAGLRKGAALEADLVREFIEPGRSGTSVDNRPAFQEMLAWIKEQGDIDYVIVYTFSRAFRNAVDAGLTKRTLAKYGTRIVSTTLDLGESPESSMIETIMHAVDQYQSEQAGADIRYKMSEKLRHGGTIGRAPLGYLNVTEEYEGRPVRTIAVDPERSPLIETAFILFATGEYSVRRLEAEMEERGLRTRGTRRWPSKPVSEKQWREILANPYYLGLVTSKGKQIPGRHEAIVDAEIFAKVQGILDMRAKPGSRDRSLAHYLRGILRCQQCQDEGRESRLFYTESAGNGGMYGYFICRGRQLLVSATFPTCRRTALRRQLLLSTRLRDARGLRRHRKPTSRGDAQVIDAMSSVAETTQ
jgi:site-specific DNA recombinase